MVRQQMTVAEASVRNSDEFIKRFSILDDSACGLTLVRTREPYRAFGAIRGYAFGQPNMDCRIWTCLYGWGKHDKQDLSKDPEITADTEDMVSALKAVGGVDGGDSFQDGIFVMIYPHSWMKPGNTNPVITQLLKEYAQLFAENEKRIVLVVPPGYSPPLELEEDLTIMDFDTPSYAEMREAWDALMKNFDQKKTPKFENDGINQVLAAAAGMSQSEFDQAISQAMVTHRSKLPNITVEQMLDVVMKVKIEVVKRSEVLEIMPTGKMEDVGGLDALKKWLQDRSMCFSQEAVDQGIDKPRGIALIGPPGTGKSLAAKASAHMLGLPLVKFDVSRVFQSLVGQSEERVRAALKTLDAMAPCVVLLDEVDKAFQVTSGGDGGTAQRVLGLVLTHMQESDKPIFWVASANRVDNLPSEFLRRGRLDEVFSVTLPVESEIKEVFEIHLRKRGVDPSEVEGLDGAVVKGIGFVPAEHEAAIKDAKIEAFVDGVPITGDLIARQFGQMKPLSEAFKEQFDRMQDWADQNARPASVNKTRVKTRKRPAPTALKKDGSSRAVDLDG